MQCPRCQHDNPIDAAFCEECGARIESACPSCGEANRAGAKFCRKCGEALTQRASVGRESPAKLASPESYIPKHLAEKILTSKSALEGERKQVTVLFADLKGSMELLADRDAEEARKLLDPVIEHMMEAVHHYEGTVNQVMGDGVMALFGAPLAHEDHAVRACFAALRMHGSIRRYAEEVRRTHGIEIQIRVGLNSGEVVVRSIGSDLRMDYSAVGQTTHLSARMEQLASPGTTRLTASTLALAEGYITIRSIGPMPVKGIAEPVEVYELTGAGSARTRLQVARAGGLTRFVGRDLEMDQLRRAAEEGRAGQGQVVAVVGEAGVGKSRLYYEFVQSHHAEGWLILESGSVSYGKATPYLPLADLFRSYFKVDARDDVRTIRVKVTGGLLTLDESLKDAVPIVLWLLDALPEDSPFLELAPSERRQQTLTVAKRILLRENQLHPILLIFEDLHWIDSETQAFLDSLVESLPASSMLLAVNYRPEYRHGWSNKTYYRQLRIDRLPPQISEDLLDAMIGADASTAPLKRLLIERTQGSPLFLEESVRTLVETQVLVGTPGAYRLSGSTETFQIPATVQAILAARIDRLDPDEKRLLQAAAVIGTHVPFALLRAIAEVDDESLRRSLAQLQTAEFIFEAQLFPDLEFAFKHALTHEVAYGSLLQERRRVLHAAIVEAMERLYADRLSEHVERLAHHATRGRMLVEAVQYLRDAGIRAAGRSANSEAAAYLQEALEVLAEVPEAEQRLHDELEIRMALGPVLISTKGPGSPEVEKMYERALELAERLGVDSHRFPALWGLFFVNYSRGHYREALDAGTRLMHATRNETDSGRHLEAHHAMWPTLVALGQLEQAMVHLDHGLKLYDRERHGRMAFLYAGHDPGACCLFHRGMALWQLGYPARASNDLQAALRSAEELNHAHTLVIALWFTGWVQNECGERTLARARFEDVLELSKRHGIRPWLSTAEISIEFCSHDHWTEDAISKLFLRVSSSEFVLSWRKTTLLCTLARLCADSGYAELGLRILGSITEEQRQAFIAPELVRLEGELMLQQGHSFTAQAVQCFNNAASLANVQQQKSLELRAAMSLARLLAEQGRREQAHAALAGVFRWFTEGFDTSDLKTARALLESLS